MSWSETAVEFVQAIADTKLVLGQRYAQWLVGGPSLEDNMGGASTAQEELGHVRQLFRLLEDQGRDPGWLEGDREPEEFRNAASVDAPGGDWPTFMCTAAPTDRAAWYLLDAIDHDDFAGLVDKIGEDEYFHLEYHDARLETLVEDDPDGVQATFEAVLPDVLAFVGPAAYDGEDDPLVAEGFTDRPVAEIREAFLAHYESLFADTAVSLDGVDRNWPPLDEWDETRRRVGGGGIGEADVEQLTGARNRLFEIE